MSDFNENWIFRSFFLNTKIEIFTKIPLEGAKLFYAVG